MLLTTHALASYLPYRSWPAVIVFELFCGFANASSVAYFTFIFKVCEKKNFKLATAVTRSALLIGHLCSSILGQFLVSHMELEVKTVFKISTGFMLAAFVSSIFLPSQNQYSSGVSWKIVRNAYSKELLVWSMISASFWACFGPLLSLHSGFWLQIDVVKGKEHNGTIEFAAKLFGALGAFFVSYIKSSAMSATLLTIIFTVLMISQSEVGQLLAAYILYIASAGFGHLTSTVYSVNIAQLIKNDGYAIVFGFNMIFALILTNAVNLFCNIFKTTLKVRFRILTVTLFYFRAFF